MKIVVSAAAQADLLRLHGFLTDKNPDAARRAVSAIVGSIASLVLFPDRGRPSAVAGTRELIVPFGIQAMSCAIPVTQGATSLSSCACGIAAKCGRIRSPDQA